MIDDAGAEGRRADGEELLDALILGWDALTAPPSEESDDASRRKKEPLLQRAYLLFNRWDGNSLARELSEQFPQWARDRVSVPDSYFEHREERAPCLLELPEALVAPVSGSNTRALRAWLAHGLEFAACQVNERVTKQDLCGVVISPESEQTVTRYWIGLGDQRAPFKEDGLLYMWFFKMGMRTCFFTSARGRIRFNRLTRKVYVLRPKYCGGNAIFEWDRLVALFDPQSTNRWDKQEVALLALYHPPFDATDPTARGEDCLFAGPAVTGPSGAAHLWEYIRQYMETGPTIDRIPADAPASFKGIARYLHPDYTTYCGLPSSRQYRQECRPGFMETFFHMSSQMTCSWPRFPEEWQSDSGMGEPEDKPVQTGAVMTALVYRARGWLSKADEVELMERYGTAEALAQAQARRD